MRKSPRLRASAATDAESLNDDDQCAIGGPIKIACIEKAAQCVLPEPIRANITALLIVSIGCAREHHTREGQKTREATRLAGKTHAKGSALVTL